MHSEGLGQEKISHKALCRLIVAKDTLKSRLK